MLIFYYEQFMTKYYPNSSVLGSHITPPLNGSAPMTTQPLLKLPIPDRLEGSMQLCRAF